MFTQKKKAYYSKILGFKTVEDFEDFSKRYLREPLIINYQEHFSNLSRNFS